MTQAPSKGNIIPKFTFAPNGSPWVVEGNIEARMLKFSDTLEKTSNEIVEKVE